MKNILFKIIAFMVMGSLVFLTIGCGGVQEKMTIVEVSKIENKNGVNYVEVDGCPYTYIGIQFRTDGFMNCDYVSLDKLEKYFECIAELNIPTVQLPLEWRDIETNEDEYDYTYIDKTLGFAEKYNLKVEYLWFSTNMCGETHSFHVPDYIIDTPKIYERYNSTYTGQYWNIYGQICHMVFGGDNLLERETKVVTNIMNYIADRNEKVGNKNTLIGVQVHNEPDCFPLWRVGHNQISVTRNGVQITEAEARADVNKALDTIGKAFKSTRYKLYTRVNFALANVMNDYIESVFALEGIDIVGDDPHESNVSTITEAMKEYSLRGNYPHVAENRATFENTPSLILSALSLNAGYIMYEIATPNTFLASPGSDGVDPDYGILNSDLTYRKNTKSIKDFLGMVKDVGSDIVTTHKDNFYAFNVETNFPTNSYEKVIKLDEKYCKFETTNGAIGFAINREDYIIVGATDSSNFTTDKKYKVEVGRFQNREWLIESNLETKNGTFTLDAYKVYKIVKV